MSKLKNIEKSLYDSWNRNLKSLGVKFLWVPEKENWGGWVATFLDPDNNVIQLIQQSK